MDLLEKYVLIYYLLCVIINDWFFLVVFSLSSLLKIVLKYLFIDVSLAVIDR